MGTLDGIVFVLGTGRCGSTLFADLLALNRQLGFVSNYDNRFGVDPAGACRHVYQFPRHTVVRRKYFPHPSEAYDALRREVSQALVAPSRDLYEADATPYMRSRLRRFFETRAKRQRVGTLIHKFTGWPRARLLAAVFPEAKFVHVVRDGRAVANSFVQQPWWPGFSGPKGWPYGNLGPAALRCFRDSGDRFEVLAALQWNLLMSEFEACERAIGGQRWVTMRYEDIIEAPASSALSVLDFVGLPATNAYTRAVQRFRIDAGRADRFHGDLPADSLEIMTHALAATLRRYGYI